MSAGAARVGQQRPLREAFGACVCERSLSFAASGGPARARCATNAERQRASVGGVGRTKQRVSRQGVGCVDSEFYALALSLFAGCRRTPSLQHWGSPLCRHHKLPGVTSSEHVRWQRTQGIR